MAVAGLALPVLLAAQAPMATASGSAAQLDSARAALAKYADPFAAIRDGYFSSLACIDFPQGGSMGDEHYDAGGMGVHFLNASLIGQPLDIAKPQVLIYEIVRDTLRLAAAEWFVPVAASPTTPQLFGRPMNGPMEGHPPIMPAELHHYDLHVWLWKTNPSGTFSSTNPAVHCPRGRYTIHGHPPTMVHGEGHND